MGPASVPAKLKLADENMGNFGFVRVQGRQRQRHSAKASVGVTKGDKARPVPETQDMRWSRMDEKPRRTQGSHS